MISSLLKGVGRMRCSPISRCSSSAIRQGTRVGRITKAMASGIPFGTSVKDASRPIPLSAKGHGVLPDTNQRKPLLETRDRFKQMFIYLQSGQFENAVRVVETCYARGYSLPKSDVFMLVSRLTDGKEFDLANRLLAVFEQYDMPFVIRNASLFCYVLLLSGDVAKAFSVISRASDQWLAEWSEEKTASARSLKAPLLPQEYLFVRLCIQMLNDSNGIHGSISPFSQTLPRRNADADPSLHCEEIITCYLHSWQYLLAALHAKMQNASPLSMDENGLQDAARNAQRSPDLTEFFASPYAASNGTHTLEQCKFSSFTLQHGEDLVRTTLRSLSLVMWYFYSRSVYEFAPAPTPSRQSSEALLETVFDVMQHSFQHWNPSIFQFFVFFFSQPARRPSPSTPLAMRSVARVTRLLQEMKDGVPLADALALMLLKKPDLPVEAMRAIVDSFLNENQPRIQLQAQLASHGELFETYLSELARRGAAKEVEAFYRHLRYLSLPLTEEMANAVLLIACYMELKPLQGAILRDMRDGGLRLRDDVAVCVLYERADGERTEPVLELAKRSGEWRVCLSHLLLLTEESPAGHRVVQEVCRQEGVQLDATTCAQLVPFYTQKQDYRNLLRLDSFVSRGKIGLPAEAREMLSDVTDTIRTSESRLFGRGSILEGSLETKNHRQLARQNGKYMDEWAKPSVKAMMSLFRKEEQSVSIDAIIKSAVCEFCASSIHEYGTWLWCVSQQKRELKNPRNIGNSTPAHTAVVITKAGAQTTIPQSVHHESRVARVHVRSEHDMDGPRQRKSILTHKVRRIQSNIIKHIR